MKYLASGISSTTLESVLPHSNGSMTNKTVATTMDYEGGKCNELSFTLLQLYAT